MTALMVGVMIASLVVAIAGTTTSIVQAENAAQAAADRAKAASKLTEAENKQTARQMRKDQARQLAVQRVQFGKAGVVSSQGTSLDVLADNAGQFEIEARAVERFGANAAAFGRTAATNAKTAGQFGVAGATLRGAGEVVGTLSSFAASQKAPTKTTPATAEAVGGV